MDTVLENDNTSLDNWHFSDESMTKFERERELRLVHFCNIEFIGYISESILLKTAKIICSGNEDMLKGWIMTTLIKRIKLYKSKAMNHVKQADFIRLCQWMTDTHILYKEEQSPEEHMIYMARQCHKMADHLRKSEPVRFEDHIEALYHTELVFTKQWSKIKKGNEVKEEKIFVTEEDIIDALSYL